MAHITGGGLTENLPRTLPRNLAAQIDRATWNVPLIFKFLQENGKVSQAEMFKTFNMGVGFVLIVPPDFAEHAISEAGKHGCDAEVMGRVVEGDGQVEYI
jgi:phosphoribosylformylglycinamidine cyclo-ligase